MFKFYFVYFVDKKTKKVNKADIKSCKINKKGVYRFTVSYKGSDNYKSNNKKGLIKVF